MPDSNSFIPLPRELLTYPAARTQRTTFLQKLKDTFYVFAGKRPGWIEGRTDNPGRLGIFDYVTFSIPRLFSKALFGAAGFIDRWNNDRYIAPQILKFFPGGLAMVFELARYLVAAAATIAVSPVVLVVHGVSSLVGNKQYNEALKIRGNSGQASEETLQDYIDRHYTNADADELRLTKIDAEVMVSGTRTIILEFSEKKNKPQTDPRPPQPFVVKLTQQENGGDHSQKQSLDALMNLNMFKAHSRISEGCTTPEFTVGLGVATHFGRSGESRKISDDLKDLILPRM